MNKRPIYGPEQTEVARAQVAAGWNRGAGTCGSKAALVQCSVVEMQAKWVCVRLTYLQAAQQL